MDTDLISFLVCELETPFFCGAVKETPPITEPTFLPGPLFPTGQSECVEERRGRSPAKEKQK